MNKSLTFHDGIRNDQFRKSNRTHKSLAIHMCFSVRSIFETVEAGIAFICIEESFKFLDSFLSFQNDECLMRFKPIAKLNLTCLVEMKQNQRVICQNGSITHRMSFT